MATIKPDATCRVCDATFRKRAWNHSCCTKRCLYLHKKFGTSAKEAMARTGDAQCQRCGESYVRTNRAQRHCPAHSRQTGRKSAYNRAQVERWRYGITSQELLEQQGGECPICYRTIDLSASRGYAIDHDHGCCPGTETCGKCIRGLLCHTCNRHLGFIEKPGFLERANAYLERSRKGKNPVGPG